MGASKHPVHNESEPPLSLVNVGRAVHDREWAAKMREIGLQPSTMGQPGGRETGQTVSHYIVPGGQFARAYQKLEGTGFQLRWQSRTEGDGTVRKSKRASKTKFTCPECGQNAWGKPDSLLICGECYENGDADVCYLLGEPDDE